MTARLLRFPSLRPAALTCARKYALAQGSLFGAARRGVHSSGAVASRRGAEGGSLQLKGRARTAEAASHPRHGQFAVLLGPSGDGRRAGDGEREAQPSSAWSRGRHPAEEAMRELTLSTTRGMSTAMSLSLGRGMGVGGGGEHVGVSGAGGGGVVGLSDVGSGSGSVTASWSQGGHPAEVAMRELGRELSVAAGDAYVELNKAERSLATSVGDGLAELGVAVVGPEAWEEGTARSYRWVVKHGDEAIFLSLMTCLGWSVGQGTLGQTVWLNTAAALLTSGGHGFLG